MLTRNNLIAMAWVALMLVLAAWQYRPKLPNPQWPFERAVTQLNKITSTDDRH